MNHAIMIEMTRLIKEHGEVAALCEALAAIHEGLPSQSENAQIIDEARNQIRRRNMSLREIVAEDTRANLAALRDKPF
ncbi:MAG TPA: hypothetical protein VHP34_11665 [Alphaproteobacteria bacterium]|nr:hypothetical protein [Alphaproteobacteria bacterium]